MNTTDTIALLWLVKAHWPHFEIFGEEQVQLQAGAWLDVLGDIPLADARAAVAQLATSGRDFAPTAGQIRTEAIRLRQPGAPDPDQAMAEVLTAVQRLGWTANMRGGPGLSWSHPAIEQTIEALGGWGEVCASDNPEALRAHFTRAYGQAVERTERTTNAPPVVAELAAALAGHLQLEPGPTTDPEGNVAAISDIRSRLRPQEPA